MIVLSPKFMIAADEPFSVCESIAAILEENWIVSSGNSSAKASSKLWRCTDLSPDPILLIRDKAN